MIYAFSAVITAVSYIYWLASQYTGSSVLLVCYLITVVILCVLYYILERRKRVNLIHRVTDLFQGGFHSLTEEDELSGLERQVVRSLKNVATREDKVNGN